MRHSIFVLALFVLAATRASAVPVFDRPAADPFSAGTLFSDVSQPREAATPLLLERGAEIANLIWWGGYFGVATPGAASPFVISLYHDESGIPADAPFWSAAVSADVAPVAGPVPQFSYSATVPTGMVIPGGVPIWISIVENDGATDATFAWRKSSESGVSFSRPDGTSDWVAVPGAGGLRLEGTLVTAVPEPASAALTALGLAALCARRGQRRR